MFNVYTLNRLNGIQSSMYIIFLSYIDISVISTSVYICKGFSYMLYIDMFVCVHVCMMYAACICVCMYLRMNVCMYICYS